jgi:hypothetical protein
MNEDAKIGITDLFYTVDIKGYEIRYNKESQVLSIHKDYRPKPVFKKKLNNPMTLSDFKWYLSGIKFTIFGNILQSENYTEEL